MKSYKDVRYRRVRVSSSWDLGTSHRSTDYGKYMVFEYPAMLPACSVGLKVAAIPQNNHIMCTEER